MEEKIPQYDPQLPCVQNFKIAFEKGRQIERDEIKKKIEEVFPHNWLDPKLRNFNLGDERHVESLIYNIKQELLNSLGYKK